MTSQARLASKSLFSSYDWMSTFGWLANFKSLPSIAWRAPSSSAVLMASPRAWSPNRVLTTDSGTLPGRNPGILTVAAISSSFFVTSASISSAVMTILYSRSKPSDLVSETFIEPSIPLLLHAQRKQSGLGRLARSGDAFRAKPLHRQIYRKHQWCGRRDLNPHDFRHWYLKPARLPIPPRPQITHCDLRCYTGLRTDATHYPRLGFVSKKTNDGASDRFRTGDLQCHKLAL